MPLEKVPNKYYGYALLNSETVIPRNSSYINLKGKLIEYSGSKSTIPDGGITHDVIIGDGPVFVGLDCHLNFYIYNGHSLKVTNRGDKDKTDKHGFLIKDDKNHFKCNFRESIYEFETTIKGFKICIKRVCWPRSFLKQHTIPRGLYVEMVQPDGNVWNGFTNDIYDWKGNLYMDHLDLFSKCFKSYRTVKEIYKSDITFKEAI